MIRLKSSPQSTTTTTTTTPSPAVTSSDHASPNTTVDHHRTLASSYLIVVNSPSNDDDIDDDDETWTLHPIDVNDRGNAAVSALYDDYSNEIIPSSPDGDDASSSVAIRMTCRDTVDERQRTTIRVIVDHLRRDNDADDRDDDDESLLLATLSRLMMQRCGIRLLQKKQKDDNNDDDDDDASSSSPPDVRFTMTHHRISDSPPSSSSFDSFDDESFILPLTARHLTTSIFSTIHPTPSSSSSEMVEMVDSRGRPLATLPRPLLHQFNILHRGVGILVTAKSEKIYVHRRTSTKRVFPSCYDMFVGGVSEAGEESAETARRELREELGLGSKDEGWSKGELFRCVVGTGYNRCVVACFSYEVEDENENEEEVVVWQEEEVAWGSFVPSHVVETAARLSIERLKMNGTWPGPRDSSSAPIADDDNDHDDDDFGSGDDWKRWDFVPDGLLVWEAWLEWSRQQRQDF